MRSVAVFTLVGIILSLCTTVANADEIQVDYLSTFGVPGAEYTVPIAINDKNQIVGFYGNSQGQQLGFLYDSNASTYMSLDLFQSSAPPGFYTIERGINDHGQVVGSFSDTNGPYTPCQAPAATCISNYGVHGFLLNGASVSTVNVPQSIYTDANAINNKGAIVGDYLSNNTSHPISGYVLSPSGIFTSFDVPGASNTNPTGVNSVGQIVGTTIIGTAQYGFVRSATGDTYKTFQLSGALDTIASGMNDAGMIVGIYQANIGSNLVGYVLSPYGSYAQIDIPNSYFTDVSGINNEDYVVGSYKNATGEFGFLARVSPAERVPEPSSGLMLVTSLGFFARLQQRRRGIR